MTFSQLADIADILAAVGVIISLLFVGWEIRKGTQQTRLTNWESVIDRFNQLWGRTSDNPALADIIVRGRQGLANLTEAEQIVFGCYLEEMVISYESIIVDGAHPSAPKEAMQGLARKHLTYHFSFPGAKEWWALWKERAGPPPSTIDFFDSIISDTPVRRGNAHE